MLQLRIAIPQLHALQLRSFTMVSARARRARHFVSSVPLFPNGPASPIPSHVPLPPVASPPSFPTQILPPIPRYAPKEVVISPLPDADLVKIVDACVSDKFELLAADLFSSFSADCDKFLATARTKFANLAKDLKLEGSIRQIKQEVVADVAEVVTSYVGKWLEDLDNKREKLSRRVVSIKVALEEQLSLCVSPVCSSCLATTCRLGARSFGSRSPGSRLEIDGPGTGVGFSVPSVFQKKIVSMHVGYARDLSR